MENSDESKLNNCYEIIEKPHLILKICNVCAIANLRCHLNLSHIAQNGIDVEYDGFLNVLKTKLRNPKVGLAQFWSNGKMSVFGCDTIENAKKGCRILARRIKKLGYDVKFENFQIVNILTRLQLPFRIRIHEMVNCDPLKFMYEPELDPNLYFYPNPKNRGRKFNEYKTMAKLTSNGKVTIHSMSMEQAANIADEVYRLSLNYIIEEINDLTSFASGLPSQLTSDQNSNSKPRKRVFVKTYVEEIDSTVDIADKSLSNVNFSTENGINLKPDNANSGKELEFEFNNITPLNNAYHTTLNINGNNNCELSVFETQQVLDDLLN